MLTRAHEQDLADPTGDSNRAWRISQGGNLGSSQGCDCADDRTLDETRNNVPEDARDVACARVPGLLRWVVDWHPKKEHRGVCGVVLWTEVTVSHAVSLGAACQSSRVTAFRSLPVSSIELSYHTGTI